MTSSSSPGPIPQHILNAIKQKTGISTTSSFSLPQSQQPGVTRHGSVLAKPSPSSAAATTSDVSKEISPKEEVLKDTTVDSPTFYDRIVDNVGIGEQVNINQIQVPKRMQNNVSTGHQKIDILMGGDGVTPSTVCLLTGVPGSAKTTLAVQLADSITGSGNLAVYNTCEESLMQLSRVGKRLRLKNGFLVSSHRSVFDLIEHADKLLESHPDKQMFVFVDSLQTIEYPNFRWDEKTGRLLRDKDGNPVKRQGRPTGGHGAQVEITKILTTWCKHNFAIMFIIGQVNKDGDFAGRQAIKHWVDAHMHLSISRERATHGQRIAEMTKNRFGIASIYYPFELEARGIKFLEPKP